MALKNENTELWGKFELTLKAEAHENPFAGVNLFAVFRHDDKEVKVRGFYDGEDVYKVRFMPTIVGKWSYKTKSNLEELDSITGAFTCTEPSGDNHGRVKVKNKYHFAYNDGTPYYPFGTTSYGWAHQKDKLADETVKSLKYSPFNKMRMCVLPHYSEFSAKNLCCHPFCGAPKKDWDLSRCHPEYFRMIERRIEKLLEIGVEADLILFHPYAKQWGYTDMPHEADKAYLRYVVSRFAAYRNVWWSLANEYDLMPAKSLNEWDDLCETVEEEDSYGHLLSIHNETRLYESWKPFITHATVQDGLSAQEPGRAVVLVKTYHKPVIYDEICYEGNFDARWGDLSAKEMVRRFWNAAIAGAYAGHGEVINQEGENGDLVWTAVGGKLKGESAERIGFLKCILEEYPGYGWEAADKWWLTGMAKKDNKCFLVYFGEDTPDEWKFRIPAKDVTMTPGSKYKAQILDTWDMTITDVRDVFEISEKKQYEYEDTCGKKIKLPKKQYLAIRLVPQEMIDN